MANSTIPGLVAVTVPAGTDLLCTRQSGDTRDKKLTVTQLLSLAPAHADPVLLSDGTVGAPTYSFSSDSDSGVFLNGADELSFAIGGVEGLRLAELNSGVIQVPQANVAVTAFATGGQASATQLDESYSVIGTVATTGDSVKLPPVFAINSIMFVKNDGANAADIFPATGDDLGAGLNTAVSIPAGSSMSFIATVANSTWTQWIVDTFGAGDVTKVGTPVDNQVGVWTGDGTIEGDANFTWDGALLTTLNLACDAFTSNGIDDNATGERFELQDTVAAWGDGSAAETWTHQMKTTDDGLLIIAGGNSGSQGGSVAFYGQSHATRPGDLLFRSNNNPWLFWDESVGDVEIRTGTGVKTSAMTIGPTQDMTLTAHLILPQVDDAATPTLAFGDGDTGFYEVADDFINMAFGGVFGYQFGSGSITSSNTGSFALLRQNATAVLPSFAPDRSDNNTGIGQAGADQLSLIAGGVEGLRLTELNSGVIPVPDADLAVTAFATGGQASATQLDSGYNVITTVATTGDSVKLPPVFAINSIVIIKNDGANAADVFPATGDNLGAGVDTAVSLAAGESLSFIATVADSTWTQLLVGAAGAGDVTKVGTPVDNQVGVWTGDGTIEGTTGLTYDGSDLNITGNITLTGTVDGIDIATDVAANTAKVTNATHTGQVTGATALALDVTAITDQPASGAIVDADTFLINDGGVLSEATFTQLETWVAATTAVAANTAKVTNATHTGQVTGATALSLDVTAITDQPASGALVGADTFLTNDGGTLSESTMTQLLAFIDANAAFPFTEYHWIATDFSNPNNSDWEITNLAPAVVDSNDNALTVRAFDDTQQEAVGLYFQLPTGATELTIQWISRAETAPGAAAVAKPELFYHDIPDNAAVPGNPWSSFSMNDTDIPTNEFFQYDSQTITFSTLSLTAGEWVQMQFCRDPGHANDDLTGDWNVLAINISFA